MKKVTFQSNGLTLTGNLYFPVDFDESNAYPATLVGGSLTSVKEQMAGTYAKKLAEHGIVAMAFDYRNYGESEGKPRQYEDPSLKLLDLEAAVTYLTALPYISGVGALGVCTSGGNIAYLAEHDSRVKAIATVAAWLPDEAALPLLYGGEKNVDTLLQVGKEAKKKYNESGENTIIPAYSDEDKTASHFGPMEYYMDTKRGGGVKEWKNEFSVMSWETWLNFDPIPKAKNIAIPAMIIHSDGSALPENAKKFYNKLSGEKEMVWLEGYHFDFYDQPEQVNKAVENVGNFFHKHLV